VVQKSLTQKVLEVNIKDMMKSKQMLAAKRTSMLRKGKIMTPVYNLGAIKAMTLEENPNATTMMVDGKEMPIKKLDDKGKGRLGLQTYKLPPKGDRPDPTYEGTDYFGPKGVSRDKAEGIDAQFVMDVAVGSKGAQNAKGGLIRIPGQTGQVSDYKTEAMNDALATGKGPKKFHFLHAKKNPLNKLGCDCESKGMKKFSCVDKPTSDGRSTSSAFQSNCMGKRK
jgi:hypothetical protein